MSLWSLLVALLAGCVPFNHPVSANAMTQQAGYVEFSMGCERRGITRMRIERVTIPDNSYRFVLGSVPHGFVEVTPLDPALWTQLYLEPSVVSDDDEFDGSDERVVFWHTDHFSLDEGHEGWAFGDGESGSWEDYQAWEGVTESC